MKGKGTVLVVDDEAYVRDSLMAVLKRRGFAARTAAGAEEVLKPDALDGVDVVLTDLRMPGVSGFDFVRRLTSEHPGLPVIVLTAHGTVSSAVECMRHGAFDYLVKPANPDELVLAVERALGQTTLKRELDYLRSGGDEGARRGPLGVSPAWLRVVDLVNVAAPTDTSVLFLGESGTGKEELATLLHAKSRRAAGPLVKVNCAAIPAELFESEFFGHRRGAFSGALADREGRFRVAHGGTLFLDEIGSLPEAAQAKVLRVLQDGTFERVGDSRPTTVDVRLVAATNVDLAAAVEAHRFRGDLYYRINVMTVQMPPLRERREDIAVLATAFLAEMSARLAKRVRGIDPAALAALEAYHWPGNVRELRNVIERGALLERGETLTVESLPFAAPDGPAPPAGDPFNLRARLAGEERRALEAALTQARGVRREAARLLGIDQRNLAYYLKKHDLMDWGEKP